MAQVSVGSNEIADGLLQFLCLGEAPVLGAREDKCIIDAHLEDSVTGRNEGDPHRPPRPGELCENETIRVVEGDSSIWEKQGRIIEDFGYAVMGAPDGIEACKAPENPTRGAANLG